MSKQSQYAKRQRDQRGMVKVSVWVPPEAREYVLEFAERARRAKKQQEAADAERPANQ